MPKKSLDLHKRQKGSDLIKKKGTPVGKVVNGILIKPRPVQQHGKYCECPSCRMKLLAKKIQEDMMKDKGDISDMFSGLGKKKTKRGKGIVRC
jgi:hypothetical protein